MPPADVGVGAVPGLAVLLTPPCENDHLTCEQRGLSAGKRALSSHGEEGQDEFLPSGWILT